MTRTMILVLALALLGAGRAQCQRAFEDGPSPDFLESRVSYPYKPNAEQTAEDFIANISARVPGCEEHWIVDESAMILECLTPIGRDDLLLQFHLDWYPNEGVSRVRAFDGDSGEQFDYVRYMLDLLPRTESDWKNRPRSKHAGSDCRFCGPANTTRIRSVVLGWTRSKLTA